MIFFRWLGTLPGRIYRALLDLTDGQQRALMTWGMLLGIVAIEALAWWALDTVAAQRQPGSTEAVTLEIIATYRESLRFAFVLMGLFAAGIVLIARGGAMTIELPGGTKIAASGETGKALGAKTKIEDIEA